MWLNFKYHVVKTNKKTDKELFELIENKIEQGQYIFLRHAKQRMRERSVLELDVIHLLSGKKGYDRKRNKKKDTYELPIITVIRIGVEKRDEN